MSQGLNYKISQMITRLVNIFVMTCCIGESFESCHGRFLEFRTTLRARD